MLTWNLLSFVFHPSKCSLLHELRSGAARPLGDEYAPFSGTSALIIIVYIFRIIFIMIIRISLELLYYDNYKLSHYSAVSACLRLLF